eukprot:1359544-Alexandrium_andersonii.AAC.1
MSLGRSLAPVRPARCRTLAAAGKGTQAVPDVGERAALGSEVGAGAPQERRGSAHGRARGLKRP